MALRFRRSVKIAPGVRLNASKSGLGLSVGGRGVGASFGPGGTRVRAGIPGTGLSWNEKVNKKPGRARSSSIPAQPVETVSVKVNLDEDTGEIQFLDQNDNPLPPDVEKEAKKQGRETIEQLLEEQAEKINKQLYELETIHHKTPSPNHRFKYTAKPFLEKEPNKPDAISMGLLGRVLPPVRKRRESENLRLDLEYKKELEHWQSLKDEYENEERKYVDLVKTAQGGSIEEMDQFLERRLAELNWPYETLVSFELNNSTSLIIDVDLPEIEDLPVKEASVAARRNKLNLKKVADKRLRLMYLSHIHGIAVRILGEIFHCLPTIDTVTISAFSQRMDAGTGHEKDDYLYSAVVDRKTFSEINFDNLDDVDPVATLERFDLRRDMTKTGIIKPIEPFLN